jgi:hypothetical protein
MEENMLFDKDAWLQFGQDFWVYDGAFGFEDGRYGFVLFANEKEEDDELITNVRFLFIIENKPLESRFFRLDSGNFGFTTISASWPPSETEFVAVDDSTVLSYKPKIYKGIEDGIDRTLSNTTLVSSITKTVRVSSSIYAVGGPVRVYKRLGQNCWINLSESIPIPPSFKSGSVVGHDFYDLAGFSESDMYAVGGKGNVWHFDGKLWKQIVFPTNIELDTVVCAKDGNVYITDVRCSVWVGHDATWRKICESDVPLRFFDSAWFANRLWCANDYGIWVLENNKLISAQEAKENPMPENVLGLCNRIDVSPDGKKMLVCGPDGAAVYDGQSWSVLFDRKLLEDDYKDENDE